MTKLYIGYVRELFQELGLTLLTNEYKNNKTALLCRITTGKLAGYQAELSVDGARQRLKRGKGGDFTLRVLTPPERERYMKETAESYGYTIKQFPLKGASTVPMEVITPIGKRLTTTWNVLENNFTGKESKQQNTLQDRGVQINRWVDKYQLSVVSYANSLSEKLTYTHHQGEYIGCEGNMTLKNILRDHEPTIRALTEKGLETYYAKLCNRINVKYLGYIMEGRTRTTADIVFLNTTGVFAGYKGIRRVGNIRQSIADRVAKPTIELLTPAEKCRFMSTFANDTGYTIIKLPSELKVTNKVQLVCPNGHHWTTSWDNFYRGNRCPRCSKQYRGERLVRTILKEIEVSFTEQAPIRTEGTSRFQFLDFYIPDLKVAIEYNGKQHYEPIVKFGGDIALQRTQELDKAKRSYCKEKGITLLELPHTLTDVEIKDKITEAIAK